MNSGNKYFINVEEITLNNSVVDEYFQCDLEKCKGACCTLENAYGASLTLEETNILTEVFHKVLNYLPEKNQTLLKKYGPFEVHKGNYHTRTIDERECIFVYYENEIAKCSLEKAYLKNEIDFRKPISCHLFPIKRNHFGSDVLSAEFLKICEPAFSKGLDLKMTVYEFCKDSLIRLYGKSWFEKLKKVASEKNSLIRF